MNIDPQLVQAVVVKALVEGFSEEQRALLIQGAIESLFAQARPNDYHDKRTVIEVAFADACRKVAHDLIAEEMKKPEIRDRIRAVIQQALENQLVGDEAIKRLGSKLQNALWGDR